MNIGKGKGNKKLKFSTGCDKIKAGGCSVNNLPVASIYYFTKTP
jgi:hypothetical protein